MEINLIIEYEERIEQAQTIEELGQLLESRVAPIRVKNKNITISVDKGHTDRNEDKYAYFKVYMDCESVDKATDDTEVYRILMDEDAYVIHKGIGYTPKKMNSQTRKIIEDALTKKVKSKVEGHKGEEVYVWDEVKFLTHKEFHTDKYSKTVMETPTQHNDESKEDFEKRKKKELAEYDKKVKSEVKTKMKNMHWVGDDKK